jgi:vancomycin permeability regulator SanA
VTRDVAQAQRFERLVAERVFQRGIVVGQTFHEPRAVSIAVDREPIDAGKVARRQDHALDLVER